MVDNSDGGPDADEKAFSRGIASYRTSRGWSQSELARQMVAAGWENYSQMTVSRTEKGDRPIRLSEARALAGIFGVDVEDMLYPEREIVSVLQLGSAYESVRKNWDSVMSAAHALISSQHKWSSIAQDATHMNVPHGEIVTVKPGEESDVSKEVQVWLDKGVEVEQMTPENAVQTVRDEIYDVQKGFDQAVDQRIDELRGK